MWGITAAPPANLLLYCYPEANDPPPYSPAHLETSMYIDPTTGSLVLQFLAAGVLSALAMVSRVREAVKSFFKQLIPRRRR